MPQAGTFASGIGLFVKSTIGGERVTWTRSENGMYMSQSSTRSAAGGQSITLRRLASSRNCIDSVETQ